MRQLRWEVSQGHDLQSVFHPGICGSPNIVFEVICAELRRARARQTHGKWTRRDIKHYGSVRTCRTEARGDYPSIAVSRFSFGIELLVTVKSVLEQCVELSFMPARNAVARVSG